MLSADRLDQLRQELVEEQQGLRKDLKNLEADQLASGTNAGVGNHPAEDALLTETQESMVSLRRSQEQILEQVERALHRMDLGTYGTCERCGREIDFARLEAQPSALLCIDCQRIVER